MLQSRHGGDPFANPLSALVAGCVQPSNLARTVTIISVVVITALFYTLLSSITPAIPTSPQRPPPLIKLEQTKPNSADVNVRVGPIQIVNAQTQLTADEERAVRAECLSLANRFGIEAGRTFGRATAQEQNTWRELQCDLFLSKTTHYGFVFPDGVLISSTAADEEKPHEHIIDKAHNHTHEADAGVKDAEREKQKAECHKWKSQYDVQPGSSWGTLTAEQQVIWHEKKCDLLVGHEVFLAYLKANPQLSDPITIPNGRQVVLHAAETNPVVAICICSTTRNLSPKSLDDLALFTTLLPSVVTYAETNYEYWIYLAYDIGDEFYDQITTQTNIENWFLLNVQTPLLNKNIPIISKLFLIPYNNILKKPGPAFNYITAIAIYDSADYIYRINDDTIFASTYMNIFIKELNNFNPTNIGVVGPLCKEGNTAILTHDFTHKLHHQIFTHHYPPSLSDWWMDDWVTQVYGRRRTKRIKEVIVKHSVTSHGTRYSVDRAHGLFLQSELENGRMAVEAYLRNHSYTAALADYQNDDFSFRL